MKDFKANIINTIEDTVPTDNELVYGSGEIRVSSDVNIGEHTKKMCIIIEWEEMIKHPCEHCEWQAWGKPIV